MDTNALSQILGTNKNTNVSNVLNTASNDDKADKVAKQFEQQVLSQLLSYADTDNDMSDSMFGGGAGEQAFKPFLYDEYAKGFTEKGGIGIASAVKSEILKIQEAAQQAA